MFDSSNCGPTPFPTIPSSPYLAEEFRNRIVLYVLNGGNTVAPPCREQGPFTEGGESTHLPARADRPEAEPVALPPASSRLALGRLIDSLLGGYATPRRARLPRRSMNQFA